MNFGLIGPGQIGAVIVGKLRDAGYPVKVENSKGPDSHEALCEKPLRGFAECISLCFTWL